MARKYIHGAELGGNYWVMQRLSLKWEYNADGITPSREKSWSWLSFSIILPIQYNLLNTWNTLQ